MTALVRRAPADTTIRLATPADIPALKQFRCENVGEPWTAAPELIVNMQVPYWIGIPGALVMVAERAYEVVGVIAVTADENAPDVYLSQVLAVAHAHRRLYIGYSLKLTAAISVAAAGAALITSEVEAENVAMRCCNDCFNASVQAAPEDQGTLITVVRPAQ